MNSMGSNLVDYKFHIEMLSWQILITAKSETAYFPYRFHINSLTIPPPSLNIKKMKTRGIKSFCKESGIELLVLFGSSASDKAGTAHDVDLAVKFKEGRRISKLQLIYKLDDFFVGKNIDLVMLTVDTDPLLLYEIFMKGICLFERKNFIFEKDKLRAWKLYLDTEHIRNMRSKYLKDFVNKSC